MKDDFIEYFKSLGFKEQLLERISEILDDFSKLWPDVEFTDVAVDDYVLEDGTREFTNIHFYSEKKMCSFLAANFMTEKAYVLSYIERALDSVKIESQHYDFVEATEQSRLVVRARWRYQEGFSELKASSENCDHLMKIFAKYVLPRLTLDAQKETERSS